MLKIKDLTRLAEALSKIELIQEIDQLKAEVDSHRPISKEIQDRIFQKFRLDWNYNSNAIEGNKLTYGETVALLMHGVTAKGKPLKDHMDVKGHNKGINLLLDIVKSERDFTQNDIRSLHEIILVEPYSSKTITQDGIPATRNISIGQYKTTPNHVKTPTGEMHYYASPAETPALMDELMDWYEAAKKNKNIHPFITASLFHHRFVSIHPFDDGNGRMTRLLMNLILMRNQYPLIVVPMKLREEYYGVLSQADVNEFEPLVDYFGDLLKHSLKIQLKGIKGEDISDPDDIDKEIELFVKRFKDTVTEQRTNSNIISVIKYSLVPFFEKLIKKYSLINELFFNGKETITFRIKRKNNKTSASSGLAILMPIKSGMTIESTFFDFLNHIKNETILPSDYIDFQYYWKSFKKSRSSFNLSNKITVIFNDFNYSIIVNNDNVITKKLYNEIVSKNELDLIIETIMKNILKQIEKKSNQ